MAKLFLSYSRKDASRAQRFAQWLEREGHDVWRDDDDIGGGASFSSEIEKALKDCAAVLVLWSEHSVQSAWVRDEAGFGRDAGKLLPFSLDGTEPPLGFRQFQAIDLSKWKRGEPPAADRVRRAIDRIVDGGDAAPPLPQALERKGHSVGAGRRIVLVAAVLVVAAAAVAAVLFWRPWAQSREIAIAVAASPASSDPAAATDYANLVAADMAAFLPTRFDGARVIAPADAAGVTSGYRMLISVSRHGKAADSSATLSDSDGRTILWSKSWNIADASAVDLKQQVSLSASRAAVCLIDAKGGEKRLSQPALGLYVSGCVGVGDADWSDAELLAIFERIVRLAPDFPPGWAYLAVGRAVYAAAQGPADKAAEKRAREAIATARKLNPNSGLAYMSESLLVPDDYLGELKLLNKGAEVDPDNALLQSFRADALRNVGRMADSVQAAKRAVEIDPLSPFTRGNYISALTYAGEFSRAKDDIAEARKKWPNDPAIDSAEFSFQYRYGDPKAAAILMPRALEFSDERLVPFRRIIAARLDPSPAKIDEAIQGWAQQDDRRGRNQYLLALGLFGRVDEAYRLLMDPESQASVDPNILFRPELAKVRADRRFMPVAARLGLVRYWRESGRWPDFCANERLAYDCRTEAAKYPG
jgi:tetratricopeptide (TPR) repeat protein